MPSPLTQESLIPSVLDRLLDDDPASAREAPKARTQVLRELKQSVRRDLEWLLNSRCDAADGRRISINWNCRC